MAGKKIIRRAVNRTKSKVIFGIMKKKGIKQMKVGNIIYDSTI